MKSFLKLTAANKTLLQGVAVGVAGLLGYKAVSGPDKTVVNGVDNTTLVVGAIAVVAAIYLWKR